MTARALAIPETAAKPAFQGTARPLIIKDSDISRFRSLVSAPIKGIAKGALGMAKFATYLSDPATILFGSPTEPLFQKAEQKIEQNIPTRPEALEKGLERAGRIGTELALSGGARTILGLGAKALGGGLLGQAVEEAGGGPIPQAIGEMAPSILPSLARKIIPSNADQKRILDLGRKHGMTEEQLAPLMPETRKKGFFGQFAFASEGTKKATSETRKGVQSIYSALESSPEAQKPLTQQATQQFIQETGQIMRKMPANVRNQVAQDARDLFNAAQQKGGFTGDELMNWYHDISSRYNLGRAELELLKNPIQKALGSLSPELAKDFETVNRMYQKSIQIGRILSPSQFDKLISLGEAYEVGASVAGLEPKRLVKILGLAGFRKFSQQMLTNPRLQNLIEKSQQAMLQNSPVLLKRAGELIQKELEED